MHTSLFGWYMVDLTNKKTKALGLTPQTIGKTQARKEFFPLVDGLHSANAAVAITDHDKPVAVLMSYQNYVTLTAKACSNLSQGKTTKPSLLWSIMINADLETASAKTAAQFKLAIDKSAEDL